MSVFKFHLRIDIKELSPNTSRVGKDLLKGTSNPHKLIKKSEKEKYSEVDHNVKASMIQKQHQHALQ